MIGQISASNKLRTSSELAPNMFGASSELAPNMFRASSELASVMEFGFYKIPKMRGLLSAEVFRSFTGDGQISKSHPTSPSVKSENLVVNNMKSAVHVALAVVIIIPVNSNHSQKSTLLNLLLE